MKIKDFPQTHIGLTRRTWDFIRKGLLRCITDREDCLKCIEWCHKFPDYTHRWTEILHGGHKDMIKTALETEDFFELSSDATAWWEQIIANHPFAVIFAKERYAELLEKRKKQTGVENA